jgi:hypothetical protein
VLPNSRKGSDPAITGTLERIWRDAQLVKIHPSNKALTMEVVSKLSLGINPDE